MNCKLSTKLIRTSIRWVLSSTENTVKEQMKRRDEWRRVNLVREENIFTIVKFFNCI